MTTLAVTQLPRLLLEPLVRAALIEDLGRAGDITTDALVPPHTRASAAFVARQPGTLSGLDAAILAFHLVDPAVTLTTQRQDGDTLQPGDVIARLDGPARGILTGERVALNFMGHMSGIATATAQIAAAISHTRARITCTRKTTPNLRLVEKYAVRCGGGANHRFGLDDAILIKDNHIAIAGGIAAALARARAHAGHLVKIEIEVDTLGQLAEVLAIGADAVLLDNMTPEQLREAVRMIGGRAIAEASGGIDLLRAPAVAEAGVDLLSAGWLTHSARVLDIGLDI